jgi:hypothetical protein
MSGLKAKYAELESEIIETIIGHECVYPKSTSDMQFGVRALIRKFEMKRRLAPLDRQDIERNPPRCAVCGRPLGQNPLRSLALSRDEDGAELLAHEKCVVR